jgi:hypothetical protein
MVAMHWDNNWGAPWVAALRLDRSWVALSLDKRREAPCLDKSWIAPWLVAQTLGKRRVIS